MDSPRGWEKQYTQGEEELRRLFMRISIKTGIVLVTILFMGCSNSYTIGKYEELTIKGKAIIETNLGSRILVSKTIIKQDSVQATKYDSDLSIHLHARDIKRIVQKRNNALQYGIIGGLGRAAWVVLTADEWNHDDNTGYTVYWSAMLGAPVGGLGFLLGRILQDEYSFLFESNKMARELSSQKQ